MLKKLWISNYVIIEQQEIIFDASLNIITGETGAGKSILLGALSLILGERADPKSIRNASQKCVIEAQFHITKNAFFDFFEENDLDFDEETIIRREIQPLGKSRAFVNDTPVNLHVLKSLGARLINVHSQHETLSLNNPGFQLQLTDYFANHEHQLQEFKKLFKQYQALKNEWNQFQNNKMLDEEISFLKFQIDELEVVQLQPDEQIKLEAQLNMMENAAMLQKNYHKINHLLQQSENAALAALSQASSLLSEINKVNPQALAWRQRMDSCLIELKDLQETIEDAARNTFDENDNRTWIEERLNTIYRLHKKHKTTSVEELLHHLHSLKEKYEAAQQQEINEEQIKKKMAVCSEQLVQWAHKIHLKRKEAALSLEGQVKSILTDLSLADAHFSVRVEVQNFDHISINGLDKIRFLFSANPGIAPDELHKVASGGELSRLMLALKSLAAQHGELPTLIFDEIDSGISGEVGDKVGRQLEKLAQKHQVIVITHLPQIAAKKGTHFFVYKDAQQQSTFSKIKKLTKEERILEIAKMLAGEKVSDAALKNAKAILE